MKSTIQLTSTLTCPECDHRVTETMPALGIYYAIELRDKAPL